MTKRRIMEEFTIDEISAVDRPAQAHARMTIMKCERPEAALQRRIAPANLPPLTKSQPRSFEDAYRMIAQRDGLSLTAAMTKARGEFPALLTAFEDGGTASATAVGAGSSLPAFEQCVLHVRERDGVSRIEAMRRAAIEFPAALADYQRDAD